jgi:hypothetical protein
MSWRYMAAIHWALQAVTPTLRARCRTRPCNLPGAYVSKEAIVLCALKAQHNGVDYAGHWTAVARS